MGRRISGKIDGGGTRRYGMTSRNVQRGKYGRKGKVFEEKWINLSSAKAKLGFVMM